MDDALLRKYTAGEVTTQGVFTYRDRFGVSRPASFVTVNLYDADPGGTNDWLDATTTDANGYYIFPTRLNWDEDDTESSPENRRLDLYVVFEANYTDPVLGYNQRVEAMYGSTYEWTSYTVTDAPDGVVDIIIIIPTGWPDLGAMWIYQDFRKSWDYVYQVGS